MKNALMVVSLVLISNIANAADHRLAFSQSAKLEVMVEHKDGDNWCSNAPVLRFQDSGAASLSVLEQTMPKLGALLARECPEASSVSWYSIDAEGNKLQAGIAGAASEWKLYTNQTTQNEALAAAQTEVTPETTENEVDSEEVVETKTVSSLQDSASDSQALMNVDTPVETSVSADETANEQVQEITEKVAEVKQPESEQQIEDSLPTPVPSIAPTLESAKPSEESAPNNEENALAKSPVSNPNNFDVSGWSPMTTSEVVLNGQKVELQLKDQNGCVFNSQLNIDTPVEYISSQSSGGITCGMNSLATGKGDWHLTRSDGHKLGTISAHFHNGLAFKSISPEFEIQKIVPDEKMWLHIGSDPQTQVHYLVEGEFNRYSIWQFSQPKVIAVTENTAFFKNANDISKIVETAVNKLQTHLDKDVRRINFVAIDNFEAWVEGIKTHDTSNQLYSIQIAKAWFSNEWEYNLQEGQNHLFQREQQKLLAEKREAERQESLRKQAEREAERAKEQAARTEAMKQQRYLEDYQTITKQTLEQRMSNWIMEIEYDFPQLSEDYMMLMDGKQLHYRQIVELQKRDKQGNWIIKNPYPGQLVDASHIEKSGWYQLSGSVELDTSVKDDDGFPLSVFRADLLTKCEDKTCIEQFNPLQIIRNDSGDETWEPEKATLVIEKYESGQYE